MGDHLTSTVYSFLAALAGAITALSFKAFESMTRAQLAMGLFVGASFAFFVGPWVTVMIWGNGPIDLKFQGALLYLLATGSNILIPLAIKKVGSFFGVSEGKEPEQ